MKRILLFLPILIISCKSDKEVLRIPVNTEAFVMVYHNLSDIGLKNEDGDIGVYEITEADIIYSKNSNPDKYKELCERVSDNSFNRIIETGSMGGLLPNQYISQFFNRISIKSNRDWNEDYPAGSELNDLVYIYSLSPLKFIQSGYKTVFEWENYEFLKEFKMYFPNTILEGYKGSDFTYYTQGMGNLYPVRYKLSEIDAGDLKLLGRGIITPFAAADSSDPMAVLVFPDKPLKGVKHTLTVIFTDTTQKKYKKSIDITF